MQQVIIDCQTKQVTVIELSPDEESKRLEEIELVKGEAENQRKVESKRRLLRTLVELREMKLNKPVFSDEDIAEKEAEKDVLQGEVTKK